MSECFCGEPVPPTPLYFYYQGDWVAGKTLLAVIHADYGWDGVRLTHRLSAADKQFKELTGIDPARDVSITVTLSLYKFPPVVPKG